MFEAAELKWQKQHCPLILDKSAQDYANKFIKNNEGNGIIFDGFPRTTVQAEGLDKILKDSQTQVNCAIFIELGLTEIINRLTKRRVCRKCGAIYNLSFKNPKQEGICDLCQGELYQRVDDQEPTIRRRYEVYEQQTRELIAFYQKQNKLFTVPGEIGKDLVHQRIIKIVTDKNIS